MQKIDIKKVIEEMSLSEKAQLLSGKTSFATLDIPRLGIPQIYLSDGPNGVRTVDGAIDLKDAFGSSNPSTVFPTGSILSCSFNKELFYEIGEAIAKECIYYNKHILLGPAVNIKRNPLCGRNFEYLSEDPYLTGILGSFYVNGVQSQKVGVAVKHYFANNCEKYRHSSNSIIDKKAEKEIYLKPYELILKYSNPATIMSSYNLVNGTSMSENKPYIDVLRNDFNFEGFIMTDWGGLVNRDLALLAGTDLEMPGGIPHNINVLINAVKEGKVSEEILNKSVERILTFINNYVLVEKEKVDDSIFLNNYNVALKAIIEGAVLLKNKDNILPLNKNHKFLVVGDLFETMRYQGNGSSLLNPIKFTSFKDAFDKNGVNYDYIKGYSEEDVLLKKDVKKIQKNIDKYDIILFFGGQTDFIESEGFDRETFELPQSEIDLINELTKTNKKIIFMLSGGSSVALPFIDNIDALVYFGLGGEALGEGAYKLLFGEENFSGRVSETWAKNYSDIPFSSEYTKSINELYKESIFVGYRYHETFSSEVRFPFGYGLSYSNFKYSDFKFVVENNKLFLDFKVENTSEKEGKEVIQIYASKVNSNSIVSRKNLVFFEKTLLKPHEIQEFHCEMNIEDLKIYDFESKKMVVEDGDYLFELSKNSHEVISSVNVKIKGHKIKETPINILNHYCTKENLLKITNDDFRELVDYKFKPFTGYEKPYDLEVPIALLDSVMGKFFKKASAMVLKANMKKAKKIKDPIKRNVKYKAAYVMYKSFDSSNLRNASFSSGGAFSYKFALALMCFANGRIFKGLKYLLKKDEKIIEN